MKLKNMLSPRQAQLLDFVVREYVRTAEPVGSNLVSEQAGFDVSSATIRNDMQALEEAGYLAQPHTSAGRVPTDKGYRYFVNNLLAQEDYGIDAKSKKRVADAVQAGGDDAHEVNKNLANTLTDLSNSVVITSVDEDDGFYKTGLSSLFESPEFRQFDRMFELTSFFDRFDTLFNELEREIFRGQVPGQFQIYIGRENIDRGIRGETTIWARYPLPDGRTGSLTIIGPTRMDYPRNMGLVSYTTDVMKRLFDNF